MEQPALSEPEHRPPRPRRALRVENWLPAKWRFLESTLTFCETRLLVPGILLVPWGLTHPNAHHLQNYSRNQVQSPACRHTQVIAPAANTADAGGGAGTAIVLCWIRLCPRSRSRVGVDCARKIQPATKNHQQQQQQQQQQSCTLPTVISILLSEVLATLGFGIRFTNHVGETRLLHER